jgi:hypothetical protein
VCCYNSLEELYRMNLSERDRRTSAELELCRGISFPLKDAEGGVFGTISIYRREIDPPFTGLERHYADLMVRHVSQALGVRRDRSLGLAYAKFFDELVHWKTEDELYRNLVKLAHYRIPSESPETRGLAAGELCAGQSTERQSPNHRILQ